MKPARTIWQVLVPFALIAIGVIAWLSLAMIVGAQTTAPVASTGVRSASSLPMLWGVRRHS